MKRWSTGLVVHGGSWHEWGQLWPTFVHRCCRWCPGDMRWSIERPIRKVEGPGDGVLYGQLHPLSDPPGVNIVWHGSVDLRNRLLQAAFIGLDYWPKKKVSKLLQQRKYLWIKPLRCFYLIINHMNFSRYFNELNTLEFCLYLLTTS